MPDQLYARVFVRILDSSLAEDWQVRHVFEDLLKLADDGIIDMTHAAIARRTNVPLDIVTRAISVLESPDPRSRDPEDGGRRLARLDQHRDWGWEIVNWAKYEAIRNKDHARESARVRKQKSRLKNGLVPSGQQTLPLETPSSEAASDSASDSDSHATSHTTNDKNKIEEEVGYIYYAQVPGDKEIKIGFSKNPWARVSELRTARPGICVVATERGAATTEWQRHLQFRELRKDGEWFSFEGVLVDHVRALNVAPSTPIATTRPITAEDIYAPYPRKECKVQAIKAIEKAMQKYDHQMLLEKCQAYEDAVATWARGDLQFVPYPSTWFNQERFLDDPAGWRREKTAEQPIWRRIELLKRAIKIHPANPEYIENDPAEVTPEMRADLNAKREQLRRLESQA